MARIAKNLGATRYDYAVLWIALNDEPTMLDAGVVAEQLTVLLVADVFEKSPGAVARAVIRIRQQEA